MKPTSRSLRPLPAARVIRRKVLFACGRSILATSIAVLLASQLSQLSQAANVFWDTNGDTPGAGATPTGTWDNGVTANFTTDLNGAITTTTRANSTTGADTVTFSAGTDAVNPYTITVSGTVGAGGLIFEEGTVTLSGTATPVLSLGTGGIVVNSTVAGAVTLDFTLGSVQVVGNQSWTNSSAQNLVIGAGVTTGGSPQTLTINGVGVTVLNGDLTNNGAGVLSLTKSAAGTLTLAGNNSYTGATTLSAGTINVNSTTAFGATASTVALNGVTLDNTSGSAKTLANNNAFTLGGNNNFTGTSDLNLGTGAMSLNGATRTWTVNGGTLTVGGNLTGGSATIGLTKAGVGTLKLAGAANGSIGALTINAGIVELGTDLGLLGATLVGGSGGTINTSGGKILLNVAGGDLGVANGGTLTINAIIANGTQNSIDFWNTTSGTGVVVLTAANIFSGTTNLQSGIVSVSTIGDSGVAGNLGTNGTFNIGATTSSASLRYTGTGETNNRVLNLAGTTGGATIEQAGTGLLKFTSNLTATVNNSKTLTLSGSTAGTGELAGNIVNGSGTTAVAKTGTGTWTLSGANSYTGTTTISGGTLKNGSATTFSGSNTALSMSSTGAFDLGGFNASVSNISAMASTNTITNSGTADATLSVTGQGGVSLAGLFTDGSTNKLAISLANANTTPQFTNSANTFSGGLNLLNNATGTRLYINSAISFAGTPGALISSNFGTGTITIGQSATDKAGIRFDTAASGTLANAIVFNTALGTDLVGISSSVTAGVTVAGAITANSNAAFHTTASTANMTVSGAISGAGGVVTSGAGKITLSGSNSYLGATSISAGTLQFAKTNSMSASSAVSVASGATLAVNAGGTGEFTAGSTGNGAINGLFAGLGGQAGSTISYTSGALIGVDTTNAASTVTESTNLAGTGIGLTKLGTGTLALSGTNSFTGSTTINAGTLEFQANTAMSSSSAMTINNGGTLSLRADANTTFTPASLTGSAGNFTIAVNQLTGAGAGKTLTLANTYNAGATGSNLTVSSTSGDTLLLSSQLALPGGSATNTTINLSGANMTLNAGVNFNGATNGPLLTVNANSNTLLINGSWTTGGNRWSGIALNNGTLTMANGQNGGSSTNNGVYAILNGGTLNLNSVNAIGGAAAGNNFTINGGTLDNTSGSTKTLSANPNVVLNGDFAFGTAGGTSANDLNLGTGAKSLGTAAAGTGVTRTITTNGSAMLTVGGVITSNGATPNHITKAGTGTLALTGNSATTYLGATTVNAGTLLVSGSISGSTVAVNSGGTLGGSGGTTGAITVNAGGTLSPGASTGILTTTGNLTLATNSSFKLEVNTATAGTGYDRQVVGGDVSIGSNVTLTLENTFSGGATGDIFTFILNNGVNPVSGEFAGLANGSTFAATNGQLFTISYFDDASTGGFEITGGNDISLLAVPEPGSAVSLVGGLGLLLGLQRFRRRMRAES